MKTNCLILLLLSVSFICSCQQKSADSIQRGNTIYKDPEFKYILKLEDSLRHSNNTGELIDTLLSRVDKLLPKYPGNYELLLLKDFYFPIAASNKIMDAMGTIDLSAIDKFDYIRLMNKRISDKDNQYYKTYYKILNNYSSYTREYIQQLIPIALEECEEELRKNPENLEAFANKVQLLTYQVNKARALEMIDEKIKAKPRSEEFLNFLKQIVSGSKEKEN